MTDQQLRQRLLPAITIRETGRVIIGRRGDPHAALVPYGTPGGPNNPDGAIKVWRRGYWDIHDKRWLDYTEVDNIYPEDESDTARVIREMYRS